MPKKFTAGQLRARVRRVAAQYKTQEQLDAALLVEKDPFTRRELYNYLKPFLKFESRFPTPILQGEPDLVTPQLVTR